MQAIEVTHMVEAYRVHEMRRRAEKVRRSRRLEAESSVPIWHIGRIRAWLRVLRSVASRYTAHKHDIRGSAAARQKRGAA